MEDCSILRWMFKTWNLVRNNEIRNYVTHKHDVLPVYMLFYLTFFFITLMFEYLQKLLNCLIIYNSYKTNPSFSPCPWNLRSIGPSDFKHIFDCSVWSKCYLDKTFIWMSGLGFFGSFFALIFLGKFVNLVNWPFPRIYARAKWL